MHETQPNQKKKRLEQRLPSKKSTKAKCYFNTLGLGDNHAAGLNNVSETGACLVLKKPVELGTAITITMIGITHRRELQREAIVKWCRDGEESGQYLVGVQFEKKLTYSELLELGRG